MGTAHLVLALLVVHYIAAQKAGETEGAQTNVINGEDATAGEFPFMVRLVKAETREHLCGGALLNKKAVLTAAHCIVDGQRRMHKDKLAVVVGDFETTDENEADEKVIEPLRFFVHPDYYEDPSGIPVNDLAMIVLKEDVTTKKGAVEEIKIASNNIPYGEGKSVTVIGWGDDALEPHNILQKLEYKIANEAKCFDYWDSEYKDGEAEGQGGAVGYERKLQDIADGMFCAIDSKELATSFMGDSGGPVFADDGSGVYELLGLVSWGASDSTKITYNMNVKVFHYKDWIEATIQRADEDSWVEILAGGSHGPVMVHHKNGKMATICNDDVGKNEVNAICREQGYKIGNQASVRDYQAGGRRRKKESDFPPFGYTKLSCKDDAKIVMTDCTKVEYENAEAPCFDGHQLAVQCANEAWSFKVTHMKLRTMQVRGTDFIRGRVMCMVQAQKYGKDLDMKKQVQVGLVIRKQNEVETIQAEMRYKKKMNLYVGKITKSDELEEDACFACIAYLPGSAFYSMATFGPSNCPLDPAHFRDWLKIQNKAD